MRLTCMLKKIFNEILKNALISLRRNHSGKSPEIKQ